MSETTHASKARIWAQKHRSGNTTWKALCGKKNDGRADIRSFDSEEQARTFQNEWNAKLITNNTGGLADLSALARAEVLHALARLKEFNATLTEAVDFFIKHARPAHGSISVEDALTEFLRAKEKLKRSPKYLKSCKKTFYLPFTRAFPGRVLSDISQNEAQKYIDSHKNWENSSTASHIQYLRTFYNFFIRKGYANLNPFTKLEKPQAFSYRPKVIPPDQAEKLLQFALDNNHKAECACMALVFFCGVRVEEAGRLVWEDLNLESNPPIVKIPFEDAKTGQRRVNDIPPNALEWLKLCKSTGRISPNDFEQRMKRLRRKSGVKYPQNAMRHCFASYHIAEFRDAAKTAVMLSHHDPALLYQTYYHFVTREQAKQYWNILPACVKATREAQELARQKVKSEREAKEFVNINEYLRNV